MGFIHSDKNLWSVSLTQLGKKYLAEDSGKFSIDRVAFTDDEINYNLIDNTGNFDSDVLEMPMLEPSSNDWSDFESTLFNNSTIQSLTDYIPEFDYRIGTDFNGNNIFTLDQTIQEQFFDISYYILPPHSVPQQNDWFIPHNSYVDMTSFLKYNSFMFEFIPIYPSLNIGEGLTASPYWYTWEHKDALIQKVVAERKSEDLNWVQDDVAIGLSRWTCSDKYIGTKFVDLSQYRSFDNRKNGITFRIKIRTEHLSRLFSYMNNNGINTIKDYIYIVNNDPLILPITMVYGKNKYDYINKRIPIFITRS